MKRHLPTINFIFLIVLTCFFFYDSHVNDIKTFKEIQAERLSIIGPDKNLYISISNPERQALATTHGIPHNPGSKRDLPGILFFNRVGDEVGGIYYDGTDEENFAGITFDQQKNDQIMAIMKDEYLEEGEWKRWYGMFFRERSDSIRVEKLYDQFLERTKSMTKKEKDTEYLKFKKHLDSEINVYRMFLGREENKNTGLFIYDSKGNERIKIYVDESDNTRFEIFDKKGIKTTY
ncbi:hypothetical protein LS482_19675 [Sinomicrobium kalidii]|uniref:hypothetical protein n=1 Tax=Sinomicrobium kalidii TaxID=2900738 RepID=UPI001E444D36|nr:hypothetical protein [Sinomicrobium kalidii]UGU15886.1 hypothetical protein LS482_19675 [Sinomicrobium kalidii]